MGIVSALFHSKSKLKRFASVWRGFKTIRNVVLMVMRWFYWVPSERWSSWRVVLTLVTLSISRRGIDIEREAEAENSEGWDGCLFSLEVDMV